MANGTKGAAKAVAPAPSQQVAPVGSLANTSGQPATNKKKQKRRQNAAAKTPIVVNSEIPTQQAPLGRVSSGQAPPSPELDDEDDEDTVSVYGEVVVESSQKINGHAAPIAPEGTAKKKNKKKKKNKGNISQPAEEWNDHDGRPMPHMEHSHSSYSFHHKEKNDRIWNTSSHEERERIKDFWRSLNESDRKSLLKVEKDTVIKTMKEQQKHSCSCTVCGRKRHAIEEELEVLYDAYYHEIEQYALDQAKNGSTELPYPMEMGHGNKNRDLSRVSSQNVPHSHMQHPSDEDEYDDEDDYEEEDDLDSADYSLSQEDDRRHPVAADLRFFGNSLEIEGNMLTVADDLLRNDGKKFIDMMEQLAERRIQQEEATQYASQRQYDYEDEMDDEDYEDEEGDYEEDYEDDEEEDPLTNDQRMEEGRRMFQIFAARLFEQRVLNAYRQKVADERQKKLLEELELEKTNDVQREAKKQRDAAKKKEKKERAKQAKAEEKARKDAEKEAAEAAARAAELAKQDEQRKRREELRKKKESERKAQEEEKQKRELEKLRKQQEERDRQQEIERKAREAKAQEKKSREDAKRKEKEDREAKEREARERKAHADRQRKDMEEAQKAKQKTDKPTQERTDKEKAEKAKRDVLAAQQAAQIVQASARRVSQATSVAIPPGLPRSTSSVSSPHVPVAVPVVPKAPTPVRVRPGSRPDSSKTSSPKTPQIPVGSFKAVSPTEGLVHPPAGPTRKITIPKMTPMTQAQQLSTPGIGLGLPQSMATQPPPGMHPPPGFGMQSPMNGFPSPGPIPNSSQAPNPNAFLQHAGNMGSYRPQGAPMAPGTAPGVSGMTRMFSNQGLPPISGLGATHPPPGFGVPMGHTAPQHQRQTSGSSATFDMHAIGSQGSQRPAPIQRPSSVKPIEHENKIPGHDMDGLANHLGSSALLDDSDEPMPGSMNRLPGLGAMPRGNSNISEFGMFSQQNPQRIDTFGMPGSSNPSSAWSTPPSTLGFGTMGPAISPAGAPSWTSPAAGGWASNVPQKNPFGISLPHNAAPHLRPSMLQIRLSIVGLFRTLYARPNTLPTTADGFVELSEIMRHVVGVSPKEILNLCDTEGTAQNGGGNFSLKTNETAPERSLVRWEPPEFEKMSSMPPSGLGNVLGEIGSPTVGTSLPAQPVLQSPPGLAFPGLGTFH